jgi:hypothetical protein|tara:strand:+ start:181 stop:822 length:642 start_codon:yes stop_codon:yes gene_type:complete
MARRSFISTSKPVVFINAKELLRELTVDSPNQKRMGMALRNVIEPKLEERQRELVRQFEIHPITIELNAGPRATNTSGTLGGYGNLFSFIGFSSSDKPTSVISQIFNQKIKFKVRRRDQKGLYAVTFFIPDIEEIYGLTPIPWMTGKSWVKSVEEGGLTNLGQYLFSSTGFGQSSSGTGIQVKNRSSGVSFSRTPYIGKLIENFKKRLLRLDK